MRFSSLSIGWRVAILVLYFGLLALWIAAWTGFVNWLPDKYAAWLGCFIGGVLVGYWIGRRVSNSSPPELPS